MGFIPETDCCIWISISAAQVSDGIEQHASGSLILSLAYSFARRLLIFLTQEIDYIVYDTSPAPSDRRRMAITL